MSQLPKKSLRILIKAILLFVIFNYAFALAPEAALWKISLYNTLLPGKTRLPLENDLDLMFDVHEIASSPRRANEYKVILLGDSSTWGYLLNPDETSASILNASGITTCKGQPIHVYNLGYPSISVLKDLIILQRTTIYKPDLILWNITLSALLQKSEQGVKQNVIVNHNQDIAQDLIKRYSLATQLDTNPGTDNAPSLEHKTFLDRREEMARFIKDQLDGVRWQATVGELVNKAYTPLGMDVKASDTFDLYNLRPPTLDPKLLEFDVLQAGVSMAGNTPVVIINEPIQIVTGQNSDIRYNKMYPRWIYDQYRAMMSAKSEQYHWDYIDLWNIIPPTQFTDTTFHRSAKGEQRYAQQMEDIILKHACPGG